MIAAEMLAPVEVVETRGDARVPILDETIGPLPESLVTRVGKRRSIPGYGEPPIEPVKWPRTLDTLAPIAGAELVDEEDVRSAASLMGIDLPRVWMQFLVEVGRTDLGELFPSHPSAWADDQPDHEDLKAEDDTLPSRMLAVGSTLNGDWFSLDLGPRLGRGRLPLAQVRSRDQPVRRLLAERGGIHPRSALRPAGGLSLRRSPGGGLGRRLCRAGPSTYHGTFTKGPRPSRSRRLEEDFPAMPRIVRGGLDPGHTLRAHHVARRQDSPGDGRQARRPDRRGRQQGGRGRLPSRAVLRSLLLAPSRKQSGTT